MVILKHKFKKTLLIASLAIFFSSIAGTCFAASPTLGSISPSSGSNTPDVAITFTASYYDTDGWTNLKEACLLISTSSTVLINSVYLYYDQNSNRLYLRNDANTGWLGGFSPGSINTIENSQVKLNCGQTTATGSTSSLTVRWNIIFKPSYSGKAYNTYLYVKDDTGGKAGWTKKGTYTVNRPPQLGSIIPSSGTGQVDAAVNFTTTFSDPDAWPNIQYVYFLVSTSSSARTNCLYAYYNQNTNKLYLRNNANNGWLGGYAPGASNIIENSYAKLYCSQTTVSGQGDTLTVNWQVAFKSTFLGNKNIYLYVKDDIGAYQDYAQKGTWSIVVQADTTPPEITGISPLDGATFYEGDTIVITPQVTDTDPSPLEYQFSIDSQVKQSWSTLSSYAWSAEPGKHNIKAEARDTGGQDWGENEIYVFRKPLSP